MRGTPIVIIADDLSGAAELAGIAFAHGLSAEVQTRFDPVSAAQVIAVDTDSRGLSATEASARVGAVAAEVARTQPAWIFKKVDSVLRGQPRAEIEALLTATGQKRAALAPANPSRGRTIAQGRYLIGGVPLDQTPFAGDPEHPRQTADVFTLLGGRDERIGMPDVSSQADLDRLTRSLNDQTLAAGAADFFAAILAGRGHAPLKVDSAAMPLAAPAMLVCGSIAAWRQRQSECSVARLKVMLPLEIAGDGQAAAVPALRQQGAIVLAVGDEAASRLDVDEVLQRFTADAAQVVREAQPATVLVEGGATAAALARHLEWTRFALAHAAPAGVGVLRPLTGSAAPLVVIKPGSYPWPAGLWRRFCAACC